MEIDTTIEELGLKMGIQLKLDDNRACRLVFDGTLAVDIEAPEALADTLVMTTTVAGAVPADRREAVYRLLLEANLLGRGTGGATLAIDEERDEIVLQQMLAARRADLQDLVNTLEQLVQYAEAWSGRLREAALAPASEEAAAGVSGTAGMIRI